MNPTWHRKLILVGGYSYLVALPVEWVRKNTSPKKVLVEECGDGSLIIKPLIEE